MNAPESIYKIVDKAINPIIDTLVQRDKISKRLKNERIIFNKEEVDYTLSLLTTVHARASAMISHISLMLALCMYVINNINDGYFDAIVSIIVKIDAIIYISLVFFTIRSIKTIGLSKDYEDKDLYLHDMHEELVTKYCIVQIVNSIVMIATIIFLVTIAFHFLLQYP